MLLFKKRPTPSDCILRIGDAMDTVRAMRDLLDATPQGKHYKGDWEGNRTCAHEHLSEAWCSLASALASVTSGERRTTSAQRVNAVIDQKHREVGALEAEAQRRAAEEAQRMASLQLLAEVRVAAAQSLANDLVGRLAQAHSLLTLAEARATAAESLADDLAQRLAQRATPSAPGQEPQRDDALFHRLRRLVVAAIHPDKADDAAEGAWRTRLCQSLFPEIDRLMRETGAPTSG